ncbi:MAG: hypothetical protein H6612_05330 [Ignavibacteriales bacterium]|nr:hypothetical protein [Ignavibacteriales bacterium]
MNALKEELNSEIESEIIKLDSKLNRLIASSKKYSIIRLIIFLTAVILFLGLYLNNYKTAAVISASILIIIFIFLMINHNKVEASIKKFKIFIQIKKEELARSNLVWDNIPELDYNFTANPSDLEQDLNITEKNGLLQLIYTGVSLEGINKLREWLSSNKLNKEIILIRQKIIRDLIKQKRFWEKLQLVTRLSIKKSLLKIEISEWLTKTINKKGLKLYTIFLSFLCIINLIVFAGFLFGILPAYYYQFLMIYIFFYFAGFKYIKDIQGVAEFLYDEIRKFSSIFGFIENYNYGKSEILKNELEVFLSNNISPTKTLNKVNLSIEILNLRANPFIWFLISVLVPIDYLLSIKIEKFKNTIKTVFPLWLETWYKLEAYCSLAEFAYLNPDYNFAEFNESENLIETQKIGHPLINPNKKISNNFIINNNSITNIITGSNMSGKSTFLRTIGINILLAHSGSVVNAERFIVSNFNIYSCIKVSDSVVDGISYFYSEVKRLKKILSEIKENKCKSLILIDEIYKGTNNIERLKGSKALIKHLAKEEIFSVISTHDLELVQIANEINYVKNYHFREVIEQNKMTFDYRLLEGPCPTTNALEIMKIEGLPI